MREGHLDEIVRGRSRLGGLWAEALESALFEGGGME